MSEGYESSLALDEPPSLRHLSRQPGMPTHRSTQLSLPTRRRLALGAALVLLTGCAHPEASSPALSPETTAAALTARTLHDDGLRRFLLQNLGHEPAAWDFETLSWVAFYYHPSLELARAQWATARAAQTTAAARANPTLSLTPGYSTNSPAGTSPWFPALNLDFLLETSGKRDRRAAIEKFAAEAAQLNVLSTAWQVRSELRHALGEAVATERRLPLLRTQADAQRQLVALLAQRLAAGAITALELSTPRLALIKAEAAVADAQGQVAVARSHLAQALSIPSDALGDLRLDAAVAPPGPALSAAALAAARRESLQSRADVLGALARYHAAQAALQLEAAKRYPDVHLGPGYQWDQGQNKWTLGLTVELPLFHRNEGPIAEAQARRDEAAAQLNVTQAQIIAAIDNAAATQTAASAQLEHARRLRTELERQSALVQARLAAGGADQTERQLAQLELLDAELSLVDAEAAAARAMGGLEDALQVPFSNLAAVTTVPLSAAQSRTP